MAGCIAIVSQISCHEICTQEGSDLSGHGGVKRTLKRLYMCYLAKRKTGTCIYLPFVLSAYRQTPHTVTGFSPFQLIYWFKARQEELL